MFTKHGLFRNLLIIFTLTLQAAIVKADGPELCWGRDIRVTDTTLPCCEGLRRVTEVGTRHIYCDAPDTETGRRWVWGLMLVFPAFLLIFLIFGIRNKINRKKEQKENNG